MDTKTTIVITFDFSYIFGHIDYYSLTGNLDSLLRTWINNKTIVMVFTVTKKLEAFV